MSEEINFIAIASFICVLYRQISARFSTTSNGRYHQTLYSGNLDVRFT